MREKPQTLPFRLEAPERALAKPIGTQEFEGDAPAERLLQCTPHLTESAAPQGTLKAKASDEVAGDALATSL
jgi:hypothetical protein